MNDAIVDNLKNKQLTNTKKYRGMQQSSSEEKNDAKKTNEGADAWKQWQLAPVAPNHDSKDPAMVDPQSDRAQGLYRAIGRMDKK